MYLLYFKDLLKKLETLEGNVLDGLQEVNANLNKESLEELVTLLVENLQKFLSFFEELFHLQAFDETVENYPQYMKIVACANRLQKFFYLLDEVSIPKILKDKLKPSSNDYIASILGLTQEAVDFLSECDDYLTDEQLILEFI